MFAHLIAPANARLAESTNTKDSWRSIVARFGCKAKAFTFLKQTRTSKSGSRRTASAIAKTKASIPPYVPWHGLTKSSLLCFTGVQLDPESVRHLFQPTGARQRISRRSSATTKCASARREDVLRGALVQPRRRLGSILAAR